MDGLSDAATILEHGTQALKNGLLIEVRINFERTHLRIAEFLMQERIKADSAHAER